jgi:FKBP-type peptidyl-prolyl cis-trans isomerase
MVVDMKRFVLGGALASVLVLAGCDQAGADEAALKTEAAVAAAVAEVSADYEARIAALMADNEPNPSLEAMPQPSLEAGVSDAELTKDDLDTLDKKLSYIIGYNTQKQFDQDGIVLDVEAIAAGLRTTSEDDVLLDEDEIRQLYADIQKRARDQQKEKSRIEAEANRAEGEAFLAENASREGVITTESGLQYRVLEEGNGAKPSATDSVTVHYQGTLIDGTVFDSSFNRGRPATFPVNGVIPGWIEGLQLMSVGAKYEFVIPSQLAYGPVGTGAFIGPNATLLFTVELISID